MENLIIKNYVSVVKWGKINDSTATLQFLGKLEEELKEIKEQYEKTGNDTRTMLEVSDLVATAFNYQVHYSFNPIKLLKQVITKNQLRND